MRLSLRLEKALVYTQGFRYLHDVGCDHGYFPIEAILRGNVLKAIASDNKIEPLKKAEENIKELHLEEQIRTIQMDGLNPYIDGVDIISILGMGGILIRQILERGNLNHISRLILSPNSDASVVRDFLEDHHFMITNEEFLKDKGKFYQIIIAEKGEMKLTEQEKRFGPIILKQKNNDFLDYINARILKLEREQKQVKKEESMIALNQEINRLKECL